MTPQNASDRISNALAVASGSPVDSSARDWLLTWFAEGITAAGRRRCEVIATEPKLVEDLAEMILTRMPEVGAFVAAAVDLERCWSDSNITSRSLRALEAVLSVSGTRLCGEGGA